MAGFSLNRNLNEIEYKTIRIASQAYTIGDALHADWTSDAVDAVPATASSKTTNILAVAMETVTSSATSLLVALIEPSQVWLVSSTNNSSSNHRRQRMILTDKATVNNTGTDDTTVNAVVQQVGEVGAAGDKKLLVKFLQTAVAA